RQMKIGRDEPIESSTCFSKDPFPIPRNTPMLLVPKFATAMSNILSLVKSPTATIYGVDPLPVGYWIGVEKEVPFCPK
ncbi:unnamed protein product, partial [Rotaria socialis]